MALLLSLSAGILSNPCSVHRSMKESKSSESLGMSLPHRIKSCERRRKGADEKKWKEKMKRRYKRNRKKKRKE